MMMRFVTHLCFVCAVILQQLTDAFPNNNNKNISSLVHSTVNHNINSEGAIVFNVDSPLLPASPSPVNSQNNANLAPLAAAGTTSRPSLNKTDLSDRLSSHVGTITDGSGLCDCVLPESCPAQQLPHSRIVTPSLQSEPCPRFGEVRCCFGSEDEQSVGPPVNVPAPPLCGVRREIAMPAGVSLEPGQAAFGQHPWSAVLLSADNEYIGGGALLDDLHVITVAHKVAPLASGQGLKIRLGDWDSANNGEPFPHQEYGVSQVFLHPDFNPKNLHNDVAVVTLDRGVDLRMTPHINTACLPPQGASFVGRRCWVSGWGKNAFDDKGSFQRIQKEVDVPVLDGDECEARLRDTRLSQFFQLERRSFLCAGGEPHKDACTGDGGSPLVCEMDNGQFFVAGLVAWGIGCASPGVPGVYVNVASFSSWVADRTSNFKHLAF